MSKAATHLEGLRDLPDQELTERLATTRDELFRLHLGQYTNQVTSTAALQSKRRDIARILTILRSRALGKETQGQKRAEQPEQTEQPKAKKKAKKS